MKKILLGLFAITSVSAIAAEGINVYGRLGLDIYSRYNNFSYSYNETGNETGNDYYRVSRATNPIDPEINSSVKSKGRIAPSIALEITKDLGSNFEAGIGLGYVWHRRRSYEENGINSDGVRYHGNGKIPAINSVPLYVTGKYKFNTNSNVKPYIKADLGYSFNRMKSSFDVNGVDQYGGTYTTKYEGLKAKNGLYTAVGFGAEYNNVTIDLSYVFTGAKVRISDEEGTNSFRANNSAIRLTVGYKFSF